MASFMAPPVDTLCVADHNFKLLALWVRRRELSPTVAQPCRRRQCYPLGDCTNVPGLFSLRPTGNASRQHALRIKRSWAKLRRINKVSGKLGQPRVEYLPSGHFLGAFFSGMLCVFWIWAAEQEESCEPGTSVPPTTLLESISTIRASASRRKGSRNVS